MSAPANRPSLRAIWWIVCWLILAVFCLLVEVVRSADDLDKLSPWLRWIADYASDSPIYLPLVLLFPVAWWVRSGLLLHRSDLLRRMTGAWAEWCAGPVRSVESVTPSRGLLVRDWCLSLGIGALSCGMSWQVSRSLGDLPPAFHDEYSYLFQAKTLLAGRFSFPSHPTHAELFDQLHVLNLGQFASRYYPGTGLWLAPWVALGHPYWGQWLAGALTAMLIFWTGRELSGTGIGVLAGVLTAVSPGLALFSNLLLAHHPTLLGLSLFLFGFIRWMNCRRSLPLFMAGCGLAFAMICRPATGAGVGLPFGLWFAWWMMAAKETPGASRVQAALLLAGPLVLGWGLMAAYNSAITGHWWQSPYQLYTDHYTPRHVYGFNNVLHGAELQGPRELPVVTRNYDAWAENLTWELAAKNVGYRFVASWRWTLGIIPIVWICLAAIGMLGRQHVAWRLIAAAIVSLHVIHVPYWFDGIMHWHYVFESSLLWLLLVAGSTGALIRTWQAADRPWLIVWLGALLSAAVVTNYVACPPYWAPAIHNGIAEIRFPRRIYGAFRQQLQTSITELPALVLVAPDPADRHMDLVTNGPPLDAPMLIGRYVRE
ncbi:MAG: hypothetical protein JWN70_564, partial [Planctomycetaceae bacterium]|nr:hypothetical protein [Planctomycetaceae bacterium]